MQSENIAHKYFVLSLNLNDIGNLNHRVCVCLRESASFCRAFNIETKYAERCKFGVLSLTRQAFDIIVVLYVKLNLACSLPLTVMSHFPFALFNPDPGHPANFIVNHKSESIWHVRFIACFAETIPITNSQALLSCGAKLWDELRMTDIHLKELIAHGLMKHDWIFVNNIDLDDSISGLAFSV